MLSEETLQQAVLAIIKSAHPEKIILFGSYARQEADKGSDLDLIVIEKNPVNRGMEMVKIRNAIGDIGIGVDVLVFSDEYVKEWGHLKSTVLYWAMKEGRVLYEKTD